jgi:hypothetical protein
VPEEPGAIGRSQLDSLRKDTFDLDTQSTLEAVATARGIDAATLMQQIIEEWVHTHGDVPADHSERAAFTCDRDERTSATPGRDLR